MNKYSTKPMLLDFLSHQLKRAHYETIDRGARYYGSIPGLKGVWATAPTLEECREQLLEVLEGWLIVRFKKNLPVPTLRLPFMKRSSRTELNV